MTLVRKMLLATGTAAALAGTAHAQYAFPAFNLNAGGTISTTWIEQNLGTAPAGTYTSYLVVMDWSRANTTSNQWSNEVDIALGANSTGVLGTGATGPTNVSPRYVVNSTSATGSVGNTTARTNMYWTGNLTTSWTSTGVENASFFGRQSFSGTSATQTNVRVILNPVNSIAPTVNSIALPTSFVDLGTLTDTYGRQTQTISQTTSTQLNWFRFVLTSGVNSGAGGGLLDIDTMGSGGGITDTEMRLYRVDPSSGRLVPAGTGVLGAGADAHADDDDGGVPVGGTSSYLSAFSYGDTNTAAWVNGAQRNYGYPAPTAGPEAYNGRDGALVAGEYYLLVTDYNITEAVVSTVTFTGTGISTTSEWGVSTSGGGGTGTILMNLAYVPTPGSAALLGFGILASARRRRV